MRRTFRALIAVFMVIGFFILYWFIGNKILMPIFITDYCYYHNHEEPMIVYLLFDFPAGNGYHPAPTVWGYLIFGIIGGFTGNLLNRKFLKPKV